MLLRGILGIINVNLNTFALLYLPLTEAIVVSSMQPALVGVLAWLMLGEVYHKSDFISALIALLGVIFVVKPDLILGMDPELSDIDQEEPPEQSKIDHDLVILCRIMLLIYTVNSAFSTTLFRKLGKKSNSVTITLYFAFFLSLVNLGAVINGSYQRLTLAECGYFTTYTLGGIANQIFLSKAYRL